MYEDSVCVAVLRRTTQCLRFSNIMLCSLSHCVVQHHWRCAAVANGIPTRVPSSILQWSPRLVIQSSCQLCISTMILSVFLKFRFTSPLTNIVDFSKSCLLTTHKNGKNHLPPSYILLYSIRIHPILLVIDILYCSSC